MKLKEIGKGKVINERDPKITRLSQGETLQLFEPRKIDRRRKYYTYYKQGKANPHLISKKDIELIK